MDHIDTMLESDSDNILLREVRSNGSQTFSNLVRFISLAGMLRRIHDGWDRTSHLLAMGGKTILE